MGIFSKRAKVSPAPASTTVHASPAGAPAGEARIFELGSEMLKRARGHKSGVLSAKFYSDALMEWSMKDHEFKVQMFRFVDAFPVLRTSEAIFDHLTDYLGQPGVTVPPVIAGALKAGGLAKGLAAKTIAGQITSMAAKFIAGADAASALPGLRAMWDEGVAFSVDLLGETCVSDEEADHYARKYLDLIQNLPRAVAAWPSRPLLESDHLGPIPRVNVSIKISALSARCDAIDPEGSMADLMRRLLPILEAARDLGVFVNFDMEHHALKDFTIELFQRCVERVDAQAGLAMQAYLTSGVADARRLAEWAHARKKLVTVRLVKGAYWDAETIKSELHAWPCPVWPRKWMTDRCFEEMTGVLLDACPRPPAPRGQGDIASAGPRPVGVRLALGSHNVRSIAAALAGLEARGLPRNAIELQMLHGMADQLKFAAAEMGLRVREYVPVGEMIPGMAYLVRRLLENTSNESWLKAGFLDNADPGALLRAPAGQASTADPRNADPRNAEPEPVASPEFQAERHALSPAVAGVGNGRPFITEPTRDFSDARQRQAFAAAIARATVPRIANDASPEKARELVGRAHAAFPAWRDLPATTRADVLVRAAAAMRLQRDALSGVMIKEAGKTWREADADTCEAIDFCEYYARLAVPLFSRERLGRFIGELDEQWYQPRGVAAVISPWNFPLAICCGMTVAALATGNTVVLKPAEQTPGIAAILCDVLWTAMRESLAGKPGPRPEDVLCFCPGQGETAGAALVRDPRVALIAFTGSRDVGCDILHAAAPPSPFDSARGRDAVRERTHVTRVVCEMGGKNAIIVDTSADPDEAVLGVRQSAFGFQGQKCSACSRVIVVDEAGPDGPAITAFTHRLVEATRALTIADPMRPGTDIGPVIDADAAAKIRSMIDAALAAGCRLALRVDPPAHDEFVRANALRFVGPHILANVTPDHAIANDEVFGPVLAVMHARTFDEALAIANASRYKLTGGVYTRKPRHIELAKREFRVGNLYVNRGITGALVARHPFGGFGMSGVGSKAGGKDYLLQFVEPRSCAENTLRRGFAPEL